MALADITDWYGLGRCLRLNRSIRKNIKEACSSDEERKTAVLKHYIDHHPAPNWREVLWCLHISSGDDYNNSEIVKNQESLQKLYDKNSSQGESA